jgi:hypothetical protein
VFLQLHVSWMPACPTPCFLTAPLFLLGWFQAGVWLPLASMADARAYGGAATIGADVYAVGGLQVGLGWAVMCHV